MRLVGLLNAGLHAEQHLHHLLRRWVVAVAGAPAPGRYQDDTQPHEPSVAPPSGGCGELRVGPRNRPRFSAFRAIGSDFRAVGSDFRAAGSDGGEGSFARAGPSSSGGDSFSALQDFLPEPSHWKIHTPGTAVTQAPAPAPLKLDRPKTTGRAERAASAQRERRRLRNPASACGAALRVLFAGRLAARSRRGAPVAEIPSGPTSRPTQASPLLIGETP